MPGGQFKSKADLPHVKEFVEAIAKEENGWGKPGSAGLLYRGVNVWEAYCKAEANEQFEKAIKSDPEIACAEQCWECKCRECWNRGYERIEEMRYGRSGAGESPFGDGPKLKDVEMQECYLGYDPDHDVFMVGFDVWNEPVCGSAMIGFRLGKDGKLYRAVYNDHGEDENRDEDDEYGYDPYGYRRTDLEVNDANCVKFYSTGKKVMLKCGPDKDELVERVVNGIYHHMQEARRRGMPYRIIDIRLD